MLRAEIKGLDVTIAGLEQFGVDVHEAAYYAVVEAMQKAFQACYDMLSEEDHTLRDLALMGHPYGNAHPAQIHDPDEIVHYQDTMGSKEGPQKHYRDALRAVTPKGFNDAIIEGRIDMGEDAAIQRLDRWIQDGTIKMRARPWMQWLVDHYGQDWADLIEARITEAVRAAASRSPFSP